MYGLRYSNIRIEDQQLNFKMVKQFENPSFVLFSILFAKDSARSLKKSSWPRAEIILPYEMTFQSLPTLLIVAIWCHLLCNAPPDICLWNRKLTRKRKSTSDKFILATVIISVISIYPASALVGTWTRDLSLTKGVLYRWATRAEKKVGRVGFEPT